MLRRSVNKRVFLISVTLLTIMIAGSVSFSQSPVAGTGKGGVSDGLGKSSPGGSDNTTVPGRPMRPDFGMPGFGRPPSSMIDLPLERSSAKRPAPSDRVAPRPANYPPGPIPNIVPPPQSKKSPEKEPVKDPRVPPRPANYPPGPIPNIIPPPQSKKSPVKEPVKDPRVPPQSADDPPGPIPNIIPPPQSRKLPEKQPVKDPRVPPRPAGYPPGPIPNIVPPPASKKGPSPPPPMVVVTDPYSKSQ